MTPPLDPAPPPLPTVSTGAPDAAGPSAAARTRGTLGWLGHLIILTAWVVGSTVAVRFYTNLGHARPGMSSVPDLLRRLAVGTPLFVGFCVAAWFCSRASAADWRLRWRGGIQPVALGLVYSVGMRLALGALVVAVAVVVQVVHPLNPHDLQALRPQVENAVSPHALTTDPAFFWLVVTLLSFSAGLLEEIWRGGMLAGWAGAFPRAFGGRRGPWLAVLPTAVLFGLAHLYMGWAAAVMAALLGVMLGAIMVWHETIWHAVVAHALFDATSFTALAWVAHHTHLLGR